MILSAVLLGVVTACTPEATPEDAAPEEETPEVEELAETDKLVIYSPNSDGSLNSTIPAFEEKYGVKVEVISAGQAKSLKDCRVKRTIHMQTLYLGSYATYMINEDLFQDYLSQITAILLMFIKIRQDLLPLMFLMGV